MSSGLLRGNCQNHKGPGRQHTPYWADNHASRLAMGKGRCSLSEQIKALPQRNVSGSSAVTPSPQREKSIPYSLSQFLLLVFLPFKKFPNTTLFLFRGHLHANLNHQRAQAPKQRSLGPFIKNTACNFVSGNLQALNPEAKCFAHNVRAQTITKKTKGSGEKALIWEKK